MCKMSEMEVPAVTGINYCVIGNELLTESVKIWFVFRICGFQNRPDGRALDQALS